MTIVTRPRTVGELRESGYQALSVREEMRKHLIQKIRRGEEIFPGIVGYEDTAIPLVGNAILSGQDIILLGQRGQAQTLMARGPLHAGPDRAYSGSSADYYARA